MEKMKQFFVENKKRIIWTISFLLFIFLLLLFFTYVIYVKSPFLNKVRSIFSLPVVMVGNSWITFGEFNERTLILENNFKNQDFSKFGIRIDFETEEGKKRFEIKKKKVLTGMIEEEVVKSLAKEYNVSVTDEMVDMEVERLLKQNPNPEAKIKEIKDIWGISLDDYKRLVVYPTELKKRLEEQIDKESATEELKNKINQAKKELDDGRDFSDVAKKYSEGITKDKGGVFGWFKFGQLIKEVNDGAFSIETNKNSDIIESRVGFHIIKISEVENLPNGEKMVYVNQIIVKKKTLAKVLEEKLRNLPLFVPVREYTWTNECKNCGDSKECNNSCKISLNFSSKEMQDFESKSQEESDKLQFGSEEKN